MPGNSGARQTIEDARAGTDGGLVVGRVGEAQPWGEVVHVAVEGRRRIIVHELNYALQVVARHRDGRLRLQVPIAIAIEYLRTRDLKLVAEPQVDCQFPAHLPIVLNEETQIPGPRECLGIDVVVGAIAPADQHRREAVALDAGPHVGILAGGLGSEAKLPGRIPRLRVVQPVVTIFGPGLEIMSAFAFRQRGRELVHALLAVHLPVALRAKVGITRGTERRKHVEGRQVLHILRQAQRGLVKGRHKGIAPVVGVDETVIESPDSRGVLRVGHAARGSLRARGTGSAPRIGGGQCRIGEAEKVHAGTCVPVDAVTAGEPDLVGDAVVPLDIKHRSGRALTDTLGEKIIDVRDRVGVLVGLGVELRRFERHRIHQTLRDRVPREGIALQIAAGVLVRIEGIVDRDQLAVAKQRLGKIPIPLVQRGERSGLG